MKYLLLFLCCLPVQYIFGQESNRATQTQIDSSEFAVRSFEIRLVRLREALDKNDVSPMVSLYAHLLGDMRQAMERVETVAPESKCLVSMQFILNKFEAFSFDPMKPQELKPYLELFEEFSVLMSKGPDEK